MNPMSEIWTQTIEKTTGEQVMVNTADCVIHTYSGGECSTCRHCLPCNKLAAIMAIQYQASVYQPKDFFDQIKTAKTASDLIEKIMRAKTDEEIKEII